MHLAAKVGVTGPWGEYEQINVAGTELLVDAARRAGVTSFVHVSSPSVAHAGEALVGAGAEPADPRGTRGHYATSKAMAELSALAASDDAMPIVAIRPHLVWGPGDTQLVGRIVERARQGRLALVGSGTALIDTTYIDNAADALVAALDRAPKLGGRAFVVSNGEPRTVAELVARMVAAAGLDVRTAARAHRRREGRRLDRRAHLGPHRTRRRSADDELPRRAAVDRALVRPARDAARRFGGRPRHAGRGLRTTRGVVQPVSGDARADPIGDRAQLEDVGQLAHDGDATRDLHTSRPHRRPQLELSQPHLVHRRQVALDRGVDAEPGS